MTLHLVRRGKPAGLGEGDWIVELDGLVLIDRGAPPVPPGPIDYDQLVRLVFAAERVIAW